MVAAHGTGFAPAEALDQELIGSGVGVVDAGALCASCMRRRISLIMYPLAMASQHSQQKYGK